MLGGWGAGCPRAEMQSLSGANILRSPYTFRLTILSSVVVSITNAQALILNSIQSEKHVNKPA
jgi:hypothetical protein